MNIKKALLAIALCAPLSLTANPHKAPIETSANLDDLNAILESKEFKTVIDALSEKEALQTLGENILSKITDLSNALTTLNNSNATFWAKSSAVISLGISVASLYPYAKPLTTASTQPTLYSFISTITSNIEAGRKTLSISIPTNAVMEIIASKLSEIQTKINDIDDIKLLTNKDHIANIISSIIGKFTIIELTITSDPTLKAVFKSFLSNAKIKPMIEHLHVKAETAYEALEKAGLMK